MAETKTEIEDDFAEYMPIMRSKSSISFQITQKDVCPLPLMKDMPESIYGAAMMAVIRSSQTFHNKSVHGISFCVFVGLALNVITQFYVLYCTKLYICVPAVSKVRRLYEAFHWDTFVDGQFSEEAWEHFSQAGELCQLPLSQPMFFFFDPGRLDWDLLGRLG
mmetsp:Transcript_150408/g.382303  ORF Transcript_150408/g.382303 Transcript_150408/m.382303 type:complete len:163 (-) Transcript_150408:732-1220(-)